MLRRRKFVDYVESLQGFQPIEAVGRHDLLLQVYYQTTIGAMGRDHPLLLILLELVGVVRRDDLLLLVIPDYSRSCGKGLSIVTNTTNTHL
jgi:hypothetical protein